MSCAIKKFIYFLSRNGFMAGESIRAVSDEEFAQRHNNQIERKSGKDVVLFWFALMFLAVVGAHFMLNISPQTPTGFVTAEENALENLTLLVNAMFVLFVAILIGILGHRGITRHDK